MQSLAALAPDPVATDRSRLETAVENSSTLKAFAVLEILVGNGKPMTLADLIQATGVPKASLYRTLSLFEEARLVIRESNGRAYAPGPRLARFGLEILRHDSVAAARRTLLRRLVTDVGETCNLAMLSKGELVYMDRVEADWPLRLHLPSGGALPVHCSASGKLLLAFKPPSERTQFIESMPLARYTDRTICDRQLLAAELDRIAATGYSLDNEEFVLGVACVAVAVRTREGEVVAAVAVHAATARLPLMRAIEFVPTLNKAAEAIARTFA
ncbi:MAG TPA: IclR family transcriptional regulator [Lautropia sp.]|nr:IclR family transcriptional regulator [Lautropia sp.]